VKENGFSIRPLIVLHGVLWYLFLCWFLLVTVLCLTGERVAGELAYWGIILILAGTAARLFLTAELFRRSALYRYWLLSYMVLLILLSTIILKLWGT